GGAHDHDQAPLSPASGYLHRASGLLAAPSRRPQPAKRPMTSQDFAQSDINTPNGLLPIREVARQTGVNPVTLRAWERRYGLIKPQRTPKGHRLYSSEQIAQIRQVLAWLQRGVAVSQVKRLLQDALPPPEPAESPWVDQQQQWLHGIERLAERQLDDAFHQASALYPPET